MNPGNDVPWELPPEYHDEPDPPPPMSPEQKLELDALYADSVSREAAGEAWEEHTGPGWGPVVTEDDGDPA